MAAQQSNFDRDKAAAYAAFSQGQIKKSAELLKALIPKAPTKAVAADLQRDLVEVCATGFLSCYYEANQALFSSIQSDKSLARLYPELMLYVFRERVWLDDRQFIQDVNDKGGPSTYANPFQNPATYAQMQLALHPYYIRNSDLRSAEKATASAIMGLLLSNPQQVYTSCKILVGLLEALLSEQDILGAFQLLEIIDPYVSKHLPHQGVLYAEYLLDVGSLFSFTNSHSVTEKIFTDVSSLNEKLEISPDIRAYNLSVVNSTESAILALDNKLNEAQKLHEKHPMQSKREEIIKRGYFQNATEFYFAISDVFLRAVAKQPADFGWKPLFEKEQKWAPGKYLRSVMDAYRSFGLACIELANGSRPKATELFIGAAKKRLEIFETIQRVNLEGFQLPSLVDKVLIGAAMQLAANSGSPDAADIMLRGGEVLLRNVRYSISDESVLLSSQSSERSRDNARAYMNLIREKKSWELKYIKQWLDKPASINKGALISEYSSVVSTLSKLKTQFINESNFVKANGLPTVAEIRSVLSPHKVFITYFPMFSGFGRLCIDKSGAVYSFGQFDQAAKNHIRLIEFATTANYAPNEKLDSQFPVESAMYLNRLLFDGLDKCMKPGENAVMALPPEFSGIPIAALLKEPPPRVNNGYELKHAHWLIRDFSFSFVVSPRHFLAIASHASRYKAPFEYLGVGDPQLDDKNVKEFASVVKEVLNANGRFELRAIPNTAKEVTAVGSAFGAAKDNMLLGISATEEEFRSKALGEYDVIHFATHGVFSEGSNGLSESGLIFTPGTSTDSFNDGVLSASEISRLTLRGRLVVLSACNSARYNLQQANLGVHDLQAAFTIAGIPTILAALWPVESATSADLMIHFFQNWRSGRSGGAAQSLAETIRKYIDRSDTAHQHPRFWAPFEIFGNGAITGLPSGHLTSAPVTLRPITEFKSGGDIIASLDQGSDLILSIIGQWNGKRMAGIISKRDSKGREKWRVTSNEIGAGAIATSGDQIFVSGYMGAKPSIPIVRSFDPGGRLLWSTTFRDLPDYLFTSVTPNNSGVITVAYPYIQSDPGISSVFLLSIDQFGKTIRKVPIKVDTSRIPGPGQLALVRARNGRVVVAINNGTSIRYNYKRKNVLGLATTCFEGASTKLFEFSGADFSLREARSIKDFQANAIEIMDNGIFVGGERLDGCAQKGYAEILKIPTVGPERVIWKERNIFPSTVRGMTVDDGLNVVVNYERAIGINVAKPINIETIGYDKRFGDDNMAIREASLLRLSIDGKIQSRQDFSAGLSIILTGVAMIDQKPVVYGTLGGEPALALP